MGIKQRRYPVYIVCTMCVQCVYNVCTRLCRMRERVRRRHVLYSRGKHGKVSHRLGIYDEVLPQGLLSLRRQIHRYKYTAVGLNHFSFVDPVYLHCTGWRIRSAVYVIYLDQAIDSFGNDWPHWSTRPPFAATIEANRFRNCPIAWSTFHFLCNLRLILL